MDGILAGGLYGVSIGRVFFGESMFSRVTDGSKLALARLAQQLAAWKFGLIDCQVFSPHLESLGAVELPRSLFLEMLAEHCAESAPPSPWRFDTGWAPA